MLRYGSLLWILLWSCCAADAQTIDTLCTGSRNNWYGVESHHGSVYYWSVDGGTIIGGNGNPMVRIDWGNTPGIHTVMVSEQGTGGCFGDPVKRMVFLKGHAFQANALSGACPGDSVTLVATGGSSYLWGNGSTANQSRLRVWNDTNIQVIISDTSCGNRIDTLQVPVHTYSRPTASIVTESKDIFINQRVIFNYGGNASDRVNWFIQKSNSRQRSGNVVNTLFTDTGQAIIRIISANAYGCLDSAFISVEIQNEQIFFADAFTPNGDGLNDVFSPRGSGMATFELKIWNRWGGLVYDSGNTETGWDGTDHGEPMPEGSYAYICEGYLASGKLFAHHGSIQLIR